MTAAAPASPLLAFGPLGWTAYAIIVAVSVIATGVLVNEMAKSNARTSSDSKTKTATDSKKQTCDRPYSVRVHAQGDIIGGTSKSTLGAPPVIHPSLPITVIEGLALSTATFGRLTRGQKKTMAPAKARLDTWLAKHPPYGFLGEHSIYADPKDKSGGNRMDVDSYGCSPNFVS